MFVLQQDGMICKVEMSPGGTSGTLLEAMRADEAAASGVTEGTVTIKKPLASRNRVKSVYDRLIYSSTLLSLIRHYRVTCTLE